PARPVFDVSKNRRQAAIRMGSRLGLNPVRPPRPHDRRRRPPVYDADGVQGVEPGGVIDVQPQPGGQHVPPAVGLGQHPRQVRTVPAPRAARMARVPLVVLMNATRPAQAAGSNAPGLLPKSNPAGRRQFSSPHSSRPSAGPSNTAAAVRAAGRSPNTRISRTP